MIKRGQELVGVVVVVLFVGDDGDSDVGVCVLLLSWWSLAFAGIMRGELNPTIQTALVAGIKSWYFFLCFCVRGHEQTCADPSRGCSIVQTTFFPPMYGAATWKEPRILRQAASSLWFRPGLDIKPPCQPAKLGLLSLTSTEYDCNLLLTRN